MHDDSTVWARWINYLLTRHFQNQVTFIGKLETVEQSSKF